MRAGAHIDVTTPGALRSRPAAACVFALLLSTVCSTALQAAPVLPAGGQFVAGAGSISTAPNTVQVNQATSRGIVNWQSFSIGQGGTVNINNGSGATLNRVTGNDVSKIAGSLNATGSAYVVNQAGVIVMPSGKVVTGGSFVASTRDIPNSAFMAGGKATASGNSQWHDHQPGQRDGCQW